MKLGRILRDGPDGPEPRLVAVSVAGGVVVDLRRAEAARLVRAGATADGARRLAAAVFPGSLTAALAGGPLVLERASALVAEPDDDAVLPLASVTWTAPADPPSILDCSAFEQHLVNAHARGRLTVPDVYYEQPVYYKMDPATVVGHGAVIPWPAGSSFMDYELEPALVIGRGGADLAPAQAMAHVLGVTIMNDFSARDLQMREMTSGLGPSKGKDFATALGPWITTLDELSPDDLTMVARVNGAEWSRGSTATLTWSLAELVAYASLDGVVVPGQVIGAGTVGLGSGLELYRKLRPGDVVELEVDGIGVLRSTVGEPSTPGWRPEPKERRARPTLPERTS